MAIIRLKMCSMYFDEVDLRTMMMFVRAENAALIGQMIVVYDFE